MQTYDQHVMAAIAANQDRNRLPVFCDALRNLLHDR